VNSPEKEKQQKGKGSPKGLFETNAESGKDLSS